jgi:hypothetical protein
VRARCAAGVAAGFLLGGLQEPQRPGWVALPVDGVEGEERHRVGAVVEISGLPGSGDGGSPVTACLVGVAGVERDPACQSRDFGDGASKLGSLRVFVAGIREELREKLKIADRERQDRRASDLIIEA